MQNAPRNITVNNLTAGTYYIRVGRSVGHGAYQINVLGNVIISGKRSVGSTIFPLLLTN